MTLLHITGIMLNAESCKHVYQYRLKADHCTSTANATATRLIISSLPHATRALPFVKVRDTLDHEIGKVPKQDWPTHDCDVCESM